MAKFCSNCGSPLTDNSKFCPFCGMKLTDVAETAAAAAAADTAAEAAEAAVKKTEEAGDQIAEAASSAADFAAAAGEKLEAAAEKAGDAAEEAKEQAESAVEGAAEAAAAAAAGIAAEAGIIKTDAGEKIAAIKAEAEEKLEAAGAEADRAAADIAARVDEGRQYLDSQYAPAPAQQPEVEYAQQDQQNASPQPEQAAPEKKSKKQLKQEKKAAEKAAEKAAAEAAAAAATEGQAGSKKVKDGNVSTGGFFWLMFLYAIPVIGFIVDFIIMLAAKKKSLKHFSAAVFIWKIIGIIVCIACCVGLIIFFLSIGFTFEELIDSIANGTLFDKLDIKF